MSQKEVTCKVNYILYPIRSSNNTPSAMRHCINIVCRTIGKSPYLTDSGNDHFRFVDDLITDVTVEMRPRRYCTSDFRRRGQIMHETSASVAHVAPPR
jgi:hypothetical protein